MAKVPIIKEVERSTAQLGDVIQSILDESTFQSLRGGEWVLMDGRDVSGTAYALLTGITTLPDMRGRFPRMKDHGAGVNPDGDTAIGTTQGQATAKNGLNISDPGHSHSIQGYGNNQGAGAGFDSLGPRGPASGTYSTIGSVGTGVALSAGDAETRPHNVTLNFFVKVN